MGSHNELKKISTIILLLQKQEDKEHYLDEIKKEIERIKSAVLTTRHCREKILSHYLVSNCREALSLYTNISEEKLGNKIYEILKTGLSEVIMTIKKRKHKTEFSIYVDMQVNALQHP